MGSTYCKTANSLKLPSLEKIINCPLQFCPETHTEMEDIRTPRVRRFSTSDISGPLPLGTVITPPKRPPRKRKCKITRSCSVGELFIAPASRSNIMARSKSTIELRHDDLSPFYELTNSLNHQCTSDILLQEQQHNVIITCQPISSSSTISSSLPDTTTVHQCTSSALLAVHQEAQSSTVLQPQQQTPALIFEPKINDNNTDQQTKAVLSSCPPVPPVRGILPSALLPSISPQKLNKIVEEEFEVYEKNIPSSQIQGLISQNKKTFLATLLEENNNLRCTDGSYNKDVISNSSRRSSITESLREFESSLYEMLQENAANNYIEEDQTSEHSLQLQQQHLSAAR